MVASVGAMCLNPKGYALANAAQGPIVAGSEVPVLDAPIAAPFLAAAGFGSQSAANPKQGTSRAQAIGLSLVDSLSTQVCHTLHEANP